MSTTRLEEFTNSSAWLNTSLCHNAPCVKNRCTKCGHRQFGTQTRDLMKKNPAYLITELRGRSQAKKAGRDAETI